jgi:hypothetical protein
VYYWCKESCVSIQAFLKTLRSTCKTAYFWSGAEGIRTPDLRRAKAALSQLSYGPGTNLSVRPAPPLFNAPAKSRNGGLAGGRIRLVSVRLAEEDENP